MSRAASTPLMQQYREIKSRHQDAILFFRMGEFYEMFYEDAEVASRTLGLTLTSRNNGGASEVPLAGVPVKAAGEYLRRLIQQGFRVSICEQTEDPKLAKGIVKREVVETITPGAAFSDDLLDGTRNNYLCALNREGDLVGIAAVDLSTGELRLAVSHTSDLESVLSRFSPREVIVARDSNLVHKLKSPPGEEGPMVTEREGWEFDPDLGRDQLVDHFRVSSLDAFGIEAGDRASVGAAGGLLRYLNELQPAGTPHLARPKIERPGGSMPLDEMTRRNLELVESMRGGETSGTLLGVLDRTLTPMGARLLRQWLLAPLIDRSLIDARLGAVDVLSDTLVRSAMREALDGVRDVERLAGKTAAGRVSPRELRALGDSMARLPLLESALERARSLAIDKGEPAFDKHTALWDTCGDLCEELRHTLVDRPPAAIGEEPSIREGVDSALDEWRALRDGGKDGIARIQAEERARTGISSLKVGYNKVFGYFIEVSNSNSHLVPNDYQRRQTLAGAERYVTPSLKEYEERVLTSAERVEVRERELFEALRSGIASEISRLQSVARIIAELDVLASLAEVAQREGYVRPELTDDFSLEITAGRHPVVERMMPREKFIPNDVVLSEDARMIILTGPNMAGKSTILRQIGLIVLMAQIGSFVPASRARIGVIDRLFTRVGASDNLVRGQSTFMVEMSETSAILHTATKRSLVLLDEIGRGTSTYDGISIAWSVSEHLHDVVVCKTVFATHYHELTQLADTLVAVRNYNVQVREVGDEVLFLHRLEPGGADRSYGIEVGRLAGLPSTVIKRARELLRLLEAEQIVPRSGRASKAPVDDTDDQLALFGLMTHSVIQQLRKMEPNSMTPIHALEMLARLVDEAKQEEEKVSG
ncbi:MAG TPA: DNA mismatch repair protein MutS [Gemmatimonadaceae bacterium]|nr:DNA mismatch repair protein MutS [Gemmatimonadaceae bacterium]